MGFGETRAKNQPFLSGLWSNAFGFWPIWTFAGSSTVVTFTLVNPQQNPTLILIHASTR